MGLLETAIATMQAKQINRLNAINEKEDADKQAYKFATYQGKDPVDGSDVVEVNGVKTSGFKLISNAPLEIGDRVNLRPNQQGLIRVDAKNVAPIIPVIDEPVIEDIFVKTVFVYENKLYIGADRKEPKLIYTPPTGYLINQDSSDVGGGTDSKSIILNVYGSKKNDWICQFFIRPTASLIIFQSNIDPGLDDPQDLYDPDPQDLYDPFDYKFIVIDSTGVIYSKSFSYTHLVGTEINLGVGSQYMSTRIISGGYGYVHALACIGNKDSTDPLEDIFANIIYDPISGDPVSNFRQWQCFGFNSVTDFTFTQQNKNLYSFNYDAVQTDTLNFPVFDNESESRTVYLETFSGDLYLGSFGFVFAMGKNQDSCLLWRRSGFSSYIDWYKGTDPPIELPDFTGTGFFSPNLIGNKVFRVGNAASPKSVSVVTTELADDGTISTSESTQKHLGLGSFKNLSLGLQDWSYGKL
jgi:hypothetical protein